MIEVRQLVRIYQSLRETTHYMHGCTVTSEQRPYLSYWSAPSSPRVVPKEPVYVHVLQRGRRTSSPYRGPYSPSAIEGKELARQTRRYGFQHKIDTISFGAASLLPAVKRTRILASYDGSGNALSWSECRVGLNTISSWLWALF